MGNSLLYASSCPINDKISIVVPTVGQIIADEGAYYGAVTAVTATPEDFMVQLDDVGIDFAKITPFELFLLLFNGLKASDTHLVFGDLDLAKFKTAINERNGMLVLINEEDDIVIDRAVHDQICRVLRKINHLEKHNHKPGNDEARKYMIERARIKQRRAARRPRKSQLEELIIALVNTEQYKYDYASTLDLTIYQFNASVHQIIKKVNYDNMMIGLYTGTIKEKDLSQDQLNWLSSK